MDESHSGRKVSDWTGDLGEVGVIRAIQQDVKSDANPNEGEDSLMSDESEHLEVQS